MSSLNKLRWIWFQHDPMSLSFLRCNNNRFSNSPLVQIVDYFLLNSYWSWQRNCVQTVLFITRKLGCFTRINLKEPRTINCLRLLTGSFPRSTIRLHHCNFVAKTVSIAFTSKTYTTINSLLLLGNYLIFSFAMLVGGQQISRCTTLGSLLLLHHTIFSLQCFSVASRFPSPRPLLPAFHTKLSLSFLHPICFLIFKPLSYHVQL